LTSSLALIYTEMLSAQFNIVSRR